MSDIGIQTTFDTAKWTREALDYPITLRPCKIEDMEGMVVTLAGNVTDFSGDAFLDAMQTPATWKADYPNWQQALDAFVMQKTDTVLTLKKTCSADTADRQELSFLIIGGISLEYHYGENQVREVPYVIGDITSADDYVLESVQLVDHKNNTCSITIKLRHPGSWTVLKRNFNAVVS